MGKRIIISEDEKRRILGLYEQETPEVKPEEKGDLIKFLIDNKFEENQSYIGSYEIKSDDKSFGAVFTLTPDKEMIKTATIIGPEDVIKQMEEYLNSKSIPVIKTEGKIVTRTPFNNQEVIQQIVSKVKDINGESYE